MTSSMRAAAASFAAAALALSPLAAGCSDPGSNCGPTEGTVVEVVDGDTVVLESGEKIRYLMIDTPETTMGHHDCYGAEAAQYNADLVLSQKVTLKYDEECTDKYGRLLAYISVNGREVNSLMVERGYACVLHIPPNGDSRAEEFETLESQAKSAGRGVWGACDPVTCEN